MRRLANHSPYCGAANDGRAAAISATPIEPPDRAAYARARSAGLSQRPFRRDTHDMPAQPSVPPTRVSRQTRLTALIVASALFMQNLDSTVIATALPTM